MQVWVLYFGSNVIQQANAYQIDTTDRQTHPYYHPGNAYELKAFVQRAMAAEGRPVVAQGSHGRISFTNVRRNQGIVEVGVSRFGFQNMAAQLAWLRVWNIMAHTLQTRRI